MNFLLKNNSAGNRLLVLDAQAVMQHEETVAQMVAERPARARVFEKWGLAYCCGQRTVAQACCEQDVDAAAVLSDLRACDERPDGWPLCDKGMDWSQSSLSEHIDHIVGVHHQFLRDEMPRLSRLVERVANDHGAAFSEFWEMQGLFEDLKQEIESHILREETAVFPVLRWLETYSAQPADRDLRSSISLLHLICHQHSENIMLRASLKKLLAWTHDFQPTARFCNTYRVLLHDLAELETALACHLAEENGLFSRAIALASPTEN